MPAGRPSKLTPDAVKKSLDYLHNFEKYGDAIPSIVGLAVVLDVVEATLYNWDTEDHPEFLGILSKIKAKQHQVLITKGLTGDFNAAITKLVLGKHGYHERVEQSGPDGSPIKTDNTWTIKVVDA